MHLMKRQPVRAKPRTPIAAPCLTTAKQSNLHSQFASPTGLVQHTHFSSPTPQHAHLSRVFSSRPEKCSELGGARSLFVGCQVRLSKTSQEFRECRLVERAGRDRNHGVVKEQFGIGDEPPVYVKKDERRVQRGALVAV